MTCGVEQSQSAVLEGDMHILLASSSPRRLELLSVLGHRITVRSPVVMELEQEEHGDPSHISSSNAKKKACFVYENHGLMGNDLILAADTIVVLGRRIFYKPRDEAHAQTMLLELSGKTHRVITSITLIGGDDRQVSRSVSSEVRFRALGPSEISSYLKSAEWMDKAGGYGVQGLGASLIREVKGSLTNVIGLPVEEFLQDAKSLLPSKG